MTITHAVSLQLQTKIRNIKIRFFLQMNTITVITFLFPRHDKPHSLFTSAHLEKTVKSTDSSLEFICVTTELDAIESAVHSTQCFGCTNTIDLWRRPIDTLWHVTKWLGLFESYRIKWGSSRLLDPYYQEESTQYVSIRKYTICIFFFIWGWPLF